MKQIGYWLYDFDKMVAYFSPPHRIEVYNGVDKIFLVIENGKIREWNMRTNCSFDINGNNVEYDKQLQEAYRKWFDEKFEKIVL